MRRPRLFDLLKNKRFELTDDEFEANAEPNPFARRNGLEDMVRQRGPSQGLDKTARAKRGSDGVSGSNFDRIVRDVKDRNPYDTNTSKDSYGDFYLDPDEFTDDEDDLYLSPNDRTYRQNEFNQDSDYDDFDADPDWAFMRDLNKDEFGDDEVEEDDEMDALDDEDFDDEDFDEDEEAEPSRYEGIVRAVKGAYLVSKKQQPDDTYTEIWVYNTGKDYKSEAEVRKSILAGTDIDPTKNFSEDGSQEAVIDSVGNVQYITLTGMPD